MTKEIQKFKPQIKVYYWGNNMEEWLVTDKSKEGIIKAIMVKDGVIQLDKITLKGSSIRRIEDYFFSVLGSLDEFINLQQPGIAKLLRKEREIFSTFTTKANAIERLLYKFKIPKQDITANEQEIDSVIIAYEARVKNQDPSLLFQLYGK